MQVSKIAGLAAAALFSVTPAAFAQTPAQTPAQTAAQSRAQSNDTAATQTFTGCLMKETDYRRAHNLGGGAAGGVGLGDEFVLVDVMVSPAMGAAAAPSSNRPAASAASAAATTCADRGVAYRVTGTQEEKIKGLVGHQLEIQGRFKHADDVAEAGAANNKLPAEVEIVSFREASNAAPVNQPAAVAPASPAPTAAPRSTVETPREPSPAPATAPATSADDRRDLPRTASSTGLIALIGLLALGSALAVSLMRRRVA